MSENFTREQLIQYLDGELPGSESIRLEEQLQTDASLKKEYEALRLSSEAVKIFGLQNRVGAIHREMMQELKTGKTGGGKVLHFWKPALQIAAAVILLAGSFFLYQYMTLSAGALYEANLQAYTLRTQRAPGGGTPLEKAFESGKPETVISLFHQLKAPAATDCFYAAQAFLQNGNTPEAIRQFRMVMEKNKTSPTPSFGDETEYYLAMALLKNGQASMALPIFETIHADPQHAYHDKVSASFLWKLRLLSRKTP